MMNTSGAQPRQLSQDQRRQAEQEYEAINRLGQRHGLGSGGQQRSPSGGPGMYSSDNSSMPQLNQAAQQGSRYSRPWGQGLLQKQTRIIEIFDHEDYFKMDAKKVSAQEFSVQQVFQFYLGQQKRYPTQAFLEMYVHDALQSYSRSRQEHRELSVKVKKVAQLAQKLYNLTLLEETLNTRLKMGETFKEVQRI